MLLSIVPRWPASGCSKVPSPSLTENARPASQRPRCASAPRMPVITSPSMRMAPVSASPWPSKSPTVARPQAVRPVPPPPPPPSKARWNELPSSSSRPVTERTGEPPLAAGLSQAPPCRSGHAPGAVTPLAAAPPGAPKARARPVIASTRTALSPVRERSTLCPASVICALASGADSRPATASTTWSATVRPPLQGDKIHRCLQPYREGCPLRQAGRRAAMPPRLAVAPARPDKAPGPNPVPPVHRPCRPSPAAAQARRTCRHILPRIPLSACHSASTRSAPKSSTAISRRVLPSRGPASGTGSGPVDRSPPSSPAQGIPFMCLGTVAGTLRRARPVPPG